MTIEEARIFYQEIRQIKKRYGVSFSDYHEEECDGTIRFVNVTLRLKIDPEGEKKKKY